MTAFGPVMVTVQVGPVPMQPLPLQPKKVLKTPGGVKVLVWVSVTTVLVVKFVEHVVVVVEVLQVIPAGLLVTDALVPQQAGKVKLIVTDRTGPGANVAVTETFPVIVRVQGLVPLQPPPLQPAKSEPAVGVAFRVTTVPLVKVAEQVPPQLMPPGALVTVPLPLPALATVSVNVAGGAVLKVAVTAVFAVTVTVQVPVPLQPPPLQPAKSEPGAGVAVRVTTVPLE